MNTLFSRTLRKTFRDLLLFLFIGTGVTVSATPYPEGGKVTEFQQPNGVRIVLRVFGDQFYARTATDSGYTVIYNPRNKTYYYAVRGKGGHFTATTVAADKPPPKDLAKNIVESTEAVNATRARKMEEFKEASSSEWEARKKAARERRKQEEARGARSGESTDPKETGGGKRTPAKKPE